MFEGPWGSHAVDDEYAFLRQTWFHKWLQHLSLQSVAVCRTCRLGNASSPVAKVCIAQDTNKRRLDPWASRVLYCHTLIVWCHSFERRPWNQHGWCSDRRGNSASITLGRELRRPKVIKESSCFGDNLFHGEDETRSVPTITCCCSPSVRSIVLAWVLERHAWPLG